MAAKTTARDTTAEIAFLTRSLTGKLRLVSGHTRSASA
jgi:hypothetical protein